MSTDSSLDGLRREIDAIDDSIADLIVRRTAVVEKVRDLKSGDRIKIRPSREAQILRRLVGRHTGPFPRRELARIWRELIVATLAFEGPFSVIVFQPDENSGYWDLARDQYGSFTPMTSEASPGRIIAAVHKQEATVGILPLPNQTDAEPWWPRLVSTAEDMPKIVARLPFIGRGNARGGIIEAVVICPVPPEPTGFDHSYLVIETEDEVGRDRLADLLSKAGLEIVFVGTWLEPVTGVYMYLVEVGDYATESDPRIQKFRDLLGTPVTRIVFLGSFSLPINTAIDLAEEDGGSGAGTPSPGAPSS